MEPLLLIDPHGNIFIAARKTAEQLVLAPDPRSPTLTRSMSWLWASTDGGRTFDNMHGLPLDVENHLWGYESDIALDDAGHLYMVDQTYADSTIMRWTVGGLGEFSFDYLRPFNPTAQPVDDRPWLAARGDGTLLYIAQAGAPQLNPDESAAWKVYASVFAPGSVPVLTSVDDAPSVDDASNPEPPSEIVGLAYAPDGTLGIAWTRMETALAGLRVPRVYFARSLPS